MGYFPYNVFYCFNNIFLFSRRKSNYIEEKIIIIFLGIRGFLVLPSSTIQVRYLYFSPIEKLQFKPGCNPPKTILKFLRVVRIIPP